MHKKIPFICTVICTALVFTGLCTGCRSAKASGTVLDYQRNVTEVEDGIRRSNDEIRFDIETLTDIRDRTLESGSTIDELIILFGEYQRGVDKLIYDYQILNESLKMAGLDTADNDSR